MQLTQHTFDPWEVSVQIDGLPFTDFGTGDKVAVAWNNDNVTDPSLSTRQSGMTDPVSYKPDEY